MVMERLGEVVTGINELRTGMSQTVKYQDLQEFHDKHSQEIQTYVRARVDPVVEDVIELKGQVIDLSKDAVEQFDRVGRLEKQVEKLMKQSKPDTSHQKISFLGLPKLPLEDRIAAMRDFMKTKFPKIMVKDCSVFFRFVKDKKIFEETNTGYVEFSSTAVRNHVFGLIQGDQAQFQCTIGGKSIDLKKTRTKNAKDRNTALTEAADLLKKQPGVTEADVHIVWTGNRGVKCKEAFAFQQPPGSALGEFMGNFHELELPEI